MYTEELHMSRRLMSLLAIPLGIPVAVLLVLLALLPLPPAGQIVLGGGALLEAVLFVGLLAFLSRIRIAIDDQALTIAFRFLITKRIPLRRIVTCAPTDARVWGMSYTYRGTMQRTTTNAKRAVRLNLTNGAQVLFNTRHAEKVCAELHARWPEITSGAGY